MARERREKDHFAFPASSLLELNIIATHRTAHFSCKNNSLLFFNLSFVYVYRDTILMSSNGLLLSCRTVWRSKHPEKDK